jgi:ligand-binding sensor domain-containing protein/serine phosphatase RsbU (regulator of sigma subunit)
MRSKLLLLFVLNTFAIFNGLSQVYNFRNYTEDDGLPQSYIYHISQQANGYLCLSTGEGYCTFDGNKFVTLSNKKMADNFVTTHFVDSRNVTWLGHVQNGISYIKNNKLYEPESKIVNNFKVTQFAEDKKKNIWISTAGGGLFIIDTLFNVSSKKFNNIPVANSFVFDFKENIIIAASDGLYIGNQNSEVTESISFLNGKNIKQVIPVNAKSNCFWIITESEGIYGIKYDGKRYAEFVHILPELASATNNISTAFVDYTGNLWISLFGEGLKKIVFIDDTYKSFTVSSINQTNGLKNVYIQSIFQDFEGNMWFGTFGAGLIEKPIEKFSYYSMDKLKSADVGQVAVDKQGKIWIGNNNDLACFVPTDQSLKVFGVKEGFIGGEINTLTIDHEGILWIGTNANGIFTMDPSNGKFDHFSKKHKILQTSINAIVESHDNKILVGTNEGLIFYDRGSEAIQLFTTFDGLLHNNILNLYQDSKDRLWISSHGAAPYFLKDSKFTTFNNIEELKTFNVNAVCEDQDGNIWIATEGDGVFKYNGKVFSNYKIANGLLSNYCYGITVDNYNSIWVSHKTGLSEKKSFLKEFQSVSSNEGLLFVENNLNASFKDSIGDIWFGTTKGLVHYNSEIRKENNVEPKLALKKIVLNGISYDPLSKIAMKYGVYSLHIDFLAISLTNPEKVKYKYRLLGIDSLWKITNTTFVDYPNLSDGNYTFELMACNNEGLWTSIPAKVSIIIKEPLRKKIWFYPVLIILLLLLTYLIVYWRTRSLQKGQVLLQEKVDEKTFLLLQEKEQLELVKVELEHKNKDITDSINYARRIQDSLLPGVATLNKLFKDNYFIFYKPKDIVSGDFYWAANSFNRKNEESLSLACIADCTGHGVPGAFLSIMASDILKQSLTETSINNPAETLDFLNKHVTSSLNQSSNNLNRLNDGMDVAFIGIDYKKSRLYYSGANNSAYIFRKTTDQYELYELKSTKKSIGSGIDDNIKYELQLFDLVSGDIIYLFSDGYADQFGGEKDKKLNYKRFKQILMEASELPLSLQKMYIEQKFEEWKGHTEQTDDVCVMGIKF